MGPFHNILVQVGQLISHYFLALFEKQLVAGVLVHILALHVVLELDPDLLAILHLERNHVGVRYVLFF